MKAIWALGLATAVAFLALCGYVLWDTRREAIDQALKADTNLVQAVSQDISRNFELYDLSLQGAIQAYSKHELKQLSPEMRQMALFDNSAKAEYLNRMVVLDTNGSVVYDSAPSTAADAQNFSDRDYFRIHLDRADIGLYVSGPFELRIDPGEQVIAISRRISQPDGSFDGVVVGTLSLSYFDALFANLKSGPKDIFAVLHTNGTMIARRPFVLKNIGLDFRQSRLFRDFPSTRNGSFEGTAVTDGERRLYTFAQVGNLPLIVTVASSYAAIIDAWQHKVLLVGALMCVLGLVMATLAISLVQELRRRKAAESELHETAAKLAAIASTDALTGLANRRCFDEIVEIEWKRAIRDGHPISILIVDIDWFKAYNDTLGHLRGDEALLTVANCIRRSLKRPSDFAARFGGEEFVIILQNTAKSGARTIADDLQAAIAAANVLHPQGVGKRLSVSIGIVTVSPHKEDSFVKAFEAADEALYRAKHLGRNRIEHGDAASNPDVMPVQLNTRQKLSA